MSFSQKNNPSIEEIIRNSKTNILYIRKRGLQIFKRLINETEYWQLE